MAEYASIVAALQERAQEVDPTTGTLVKAAANVIRDLERRVSTTSAQSRPGSRLASCSKAGGS
jgi:hypothetical protein